MELQDKVVVVTGGARGIGKALCERFAQEKPRGIIVSDRLGDEAQAVAEAVGGLGITADATKETDIQALVATAVNTYGRLDVFFSNAGIATLGGVELDDPAWALSMNVNFMAHVYAARHALPVMRRQRSGYLVSTASAAGLLSIVGSAPYAVSKHAALALAEWLAIEHAHEGIVVSCLCPQGVFTDMLKHPATAFLREGALTPEVVAEHTVASMRREEFLISPHPETLDAFRSKATDYDRWLGGMRKLRQKIAKPSPADADGT